MVTKTLEIGGMTCGHCLRTVQNSLSTMDGVKLDELRIGKAVVTFDETQISAEAIADAVRDSGYTVLAMQ